ncbi:hypothetical protein HK098_005174 [Nowakowskiella sp. JEL0407]|nr:hypothetical protein HK098_005166 [Nowakowskiella sp. JEL0407]KAJ3128120.1 hypothetical protein HK098_005174 [Nowakowskiella sp. JEL0407]
MSAAGNSSVIVPFNDNGSASTGYTIINSALVFLMIPGIGFFYSGMSRVKNALSMIMITFLTTTIVSVQWVAFGFSLTYSETGNAFIGNCAMCGLNNVDQRALPLTAKSIPTAAFAMYQLFFACLTPAIIFGASAERFRLVPTMVLVLFWSTLVYDPVAYWTWGARGWLRNLSCLGSISTASPCQKGALDFAGGGPVHICSGFSGLAYALVLGRRRRMRSESFRPHNMTLVFLGTAMLWFGWFGFNAGSALDATPRAAMAGLVTTIAAASGALSWCLWDMIFSNHMSGLGFCSGAIAALVAITPAAGYVQPWAAIVIGSIAGIACNLGCRVKGALGFDDALDAWGIHGVGGVIGSILTGIFAQKIIPKLDDQPIDGGLLDGNAMQIVYQLAAVATVAAYSFLITFLLLLLIDSVPGLHLRPTEEDEGLGADISEMGELAYEILPTGQEIYSMKRFSSSDTS